MSGFAVVAEACDGELMRIRDGLEVRLGFLYRHVCLCSLSPSRVQLARVHPVQPAWPCWNVPTSPAMEAGIRNPGVHQRRPEKPWKRRKESSSIPPWPPVSCQAHPSGGARRAGMPVAVRSKRLVVLVAVVVSRRSPLSWTSLPVQRPRPRHGLDRDQGQDMDSTSKL